MKGSRFGFDFFYSFLSSGHTCIYVKHSSPPPPCAGPARVKSIIKTKRSERSKIRGGGDCEKLHKTVMSVCPNWIATTFLALAQIILNNAEINQGTSFDEGGEGGDVYGTS